MRRITVVVLFIVLAMACSAFAGETFEAVKKRGELIAGVNTGAPGFSMPDSQGNWTGLDVDIARAIATAVLGDPAKVKFVPLTSQQRFTALQSGEVDVLCRQTTITLTRDTSLGLEFAPVEYYDGQGIMVPADMGVKSAKQLDNATIGMLPGTTTERNVQDYFRSIGKKFKPVLIESKDELLKTFVSGRCDALTSDASTLAGMRAVTPDPGKYVILPELISKEPLATAVRQGDPQWKDLVYWTMLALIEAEDLGITSKNVDAMLKSDDPNVQRFLGVTPGNGKALGVDENWAYNIITKVGNYAEIFDRNLGPATPMKLDRGLNKLYKDGGLLYSPPFK
ncbi:MAG: amino acid ABC transporter substrate-binding protein [Syntrophobacteraceae bacterium]